MHLTLVLFPPPTCTCTALHFYDEVNTFAPMHLLSSGLLTGYNYIYFDRPQPHPTGFGSAANIQQIWLACHWVVKRLFYTIGY